MQYLTIDVPASSSATSKSPALLRVKPIALVIRDNINIATSILVAEPLRGLNLVVPIHGR